MGKKLILKELVDVGKLQKLTDHLYEAAGIPSAIIAMDGEILTGSGWQRICTEFHRKHPLIEQECIASDTAIRKELQDGAPFAMYTCPRGLTDASIPIVIEGQHVANAFAGQLFLEAPTAATEHRFREQARLYGLDEEAYVAAFREIPVMPLERFRPALLFLAQLAEMVAGIGLQRKREVEALDQIRAQQDELRSLIEAIPDVVSRFDEQGRYRFVSPNIRAYVDRRPEEMVGKTHRELGFAPEICDFLEETIRSVFANGSPHETEFAFDYHVGRAVFDWRLLPERGPDGTLRSVLSLWRDVTRHRELEVQLQHAQKMESIGRLAGGVAHDFNNLLTAITGNVGLALADVSPVDPLHELLTEVSKAAETAGALTRQLLAFSRKQVVVPRTLDLNAVVDESRKMLQRLIGEDIELRAELGQDLGYVEIDPSQVEQILVNLAVNARDAMPEGGELTLRTSNVTLGGVGDGPQRLQAGEYVSLSVTDDGQGIPPEVLDRVFEPFFTTKESGKGTGLGLASVYGAVEQNGGAVEVVSEPGCGTTFRIFLPRVEDRRVVPARVAKVPVPGGTETLVLVEDEAMVRSLAERVLDRQGYRVHAYPHGEAALAGLERLKEPVQLLITDVVMPRMNGRELAERVRSQRPEIRVLYTSGYSEDTIAHHGVLESGIEFLAKPYTPRSLAEKVREVLDKPNES